MVTSKTQVGEALQPPGSLAGHAPKPLRSGKPRAQGTLLLKPSQPRYQRQSEDACKETLQPQPPSDQLAQDPPPPQQRLPDQLLGNSGNPETMNNNKWLLLFKATNFGGFGNCAKQLEQRHFTKPNTAKRPSRADAARPWYHSRITQRLGTKGKGPHPHAHTPG